MLEEEVQASDDSVGGYFGVWTIAYFPRGKFT